MSTIVPDMGADRATAPAGASGRVRRREVNLGDLAFQGITRAFAVLIVLVLAAMALEMTRVSWLALRRFGLEFITGRVWDPAHAVFGALPFLFGTIASALLALVLAVPVALGVAVFLTEIAPRWMRQTAAFLVELLAAIPSVIYGLCGIFVLAPWLRTQVEPWLGRHLGWLPLFRGPAMGVGLLAGGLILAVMIVPTIAAVSREVLSAVPRTLREGSMALGATRWETLRTVVFPAARSGIIGAIILGLGRALGETMAVTMVIGNRPEISASLFSPSYTMASVIANEFAEATGDVYLSALAAIGLLLFLVALLLNLVARLLVWRVAGGRSAGGLAS